MKLCIDSREIGSVRKILLLLLFFSQCFIFSLFALPLNTVAPGFSLATADGQKVSLSDYQGKMVVLMLGTTWCPGCRDQSRELQKLDAFFKETGIPVLKVFLDDPVDEVKDSQRQYPMKSQVVALLGNEKLNRDYHVYTIPRLIILSREQKVLSDTGGMSADQIKAQILQNTPKNFTPKH